MIKSLKEISWQVDEPTYRADDALSYSTLAKYEREGKFNSLPKLFEKVSTPSLTFGSMVDTLITGTKEEFDNLFMVVDFPTISDSLIEVATTLYNKYGNHPSDFFEDYYERFEDIPESILATVGKECNFYANDKYASYRVKLIKENCKEYFNLLKLSENKTIVDSETADKAYKAVEALKTSNATKFYFKEDSPLEPNIERCYQLKFKTTDSISLVNYRGMMDLIIIDHATKTIQPVDLKTSSHAEWEFYKSFMDWRYDIQSRLYYRLIQSNCAKDEYFKDFKILDYKFIVVNKSTLTPLVWTYPHTQVQGTLKYSLNSGYMFTLRDPYEIGKELNYYLCHPDRNIPKDIKDDNNIVEFITK